MFSREGLALVAGIAFFSAIDVIRRAEAHPPTDLDVIYEEGFCCDETQELDITMMLGASAATGRCAEMQQEVRRSSLSEATCRCTEDLP